MEKNMSLEDRTVRPVVAMAVIGVCLNEKVPAIAKGALLAVAAGLFLTSITGKCPVYNAMKINTRRPNIYGAQSLFM